MFFYVVKCSNLLHHNVVQRAGWVGERGPRSSEGLNPNKVQCESAGEQKDVKLDSSFQNFPLGKCSIQVENTGVNPV